MTRFNFQRWALLIGALALTVALAGCGGDDNGGLSAEDQARITTAESNAAAAATAQAEAEAEAAAAMAAQAEAEAEAAAAMAAQMEAEAEAAAAMAAQTAAEAAQAMAEASAAEATAARLIAEASAAAAMADLTEAEDDLDDAETALAAANAAKTAAETAQAVAESMIDAAETAQMDAEEMAAMYKKAAEDAEAKAMMYKEASEAAEMAKMTAEEERDKYKMMYEEATDVPTVGTQVGAEGRANSWRIDNSVSDAVTTDSESMEMTTARIKKGVSAAKLMRDDDGVSFTVMEGSLARMTTADDMADSDAPSLTGWQGTALAKTSGGTTQNALVYTNIERSVTPFSGKHPYTVDAGGEPATTNARTHFFVRAMAVDADNAEIITGSDSVDDRIDIAHSVSSGNTTQTVAAEGTIRGSYDGVSGVYLCSDAACMLTWTPNGVTLYGGADSELLFQADDIATLIPDPDYQTFGVWMIAQDGPVTGNSGLIRPIAMANASAFSQEDLSAAGIIGSATYNGRATGYYATRDAGSFEAESGRFTATATLKANFDAAAAGPVPAVQDSDLATVQRAGDTATLSPMALDMNRDPETTTATDVMYYRVNVPAAGVSFAGSKIDKFMTEDGTMMEGWVVNLNGGVLRRPADVEVGDPGANLAGTTIDESTADGQRAVAYNTALDLARNASMFEGTTSGTSGAMEWRGVWDASLHGNTKAALPTGVVGTFQAVAGDAVPDLVDGAINQTTDGGFAGVVGAFGASR